MAGSNKPAPPGMKWDSDNPLGVPMLVPIDAPTASEGPVDPVEPEGLDVHKPPTTSPTPPESSESGVFDSGVGDDVGQNGVAMALTNAVQSLRTARSAYEDALDAEKCSFCISMMEALKDEDFETQIAGLEELLQLEQMGDGETTEAEIREAMDDFEIVPQFAQAVAAAREDE